MKFLKKTRIGWIAVLVATMIPVVLWGIFPAPQSRFSDFTTTIANIGQLLGLIEITLFAISLILSARSHILEQLFNGLNQVYEKHSLIGQTGLILILFHPLFLIPKYTGGNWKQAASFLWFGSNWALNWGLIALLGFIGLITLTLFLRPKYNLWKWMHKFLGIIFLLAVFHVYLIPSDTSRNLFLRIYILGLSGLAMILFTYRTILQKALVKKYNYTVSQVKILSSEILEITLKPKENSIPFKAGQFIFVRFKGPKISGESHPFSISSSPNEKELTITIKNLGDYTSKLKNLSNDTLAEIEGPFGTFSYQNTPYKNQIWIAGGIGITPFISMARSLPANTDYKIDLYYCTQDKEEAVYLNSLEGLSPAVRVIFSCSKTQGRLHIEDIRTQSGSLEEKSILLCAPAPMIQSLKSQFLKKGVSKSLLYSEEFNFFN
ncbi:MAG: ferric reductase-like transmembrane domain-containing protein [Candidatus Gracilibacteria bacterium]